MATWLANHGIWTAGNVTENVLAVSVPDGYTLKRVTFNWRVQGIASDTDAPNMLQVVNYLGIQTLPSTFVGTPPDPSHLPLAPYGYPTYRWLHWEARRMIPRTTVLQPNGSQGGTYVDDGAIGEIDRFGEVIASVGAGNTLDVWFSWRLYNWPAYPTFAGGSYWVRVLYD